MSPAILAVLFTHLSGQHGARRARGQRMRRAAIAAATGWLLWQGIVPKGHPPGHERTRRAAKGYATQESGRSIGDLGPEAPARAAGTSSYPEPPSFQVKSMTLIR